MLIALTRLIMWSYATNTSFPAGLELSLIVAVPAAFYLLAILIAESAPVASLVIYAGVPVVYFIAIFVDRSTAPPGAVEDDFT